MPPESSSSDWSAVIGATVMGATVLCAYLFHSLFSGRDAEETVACPQETPRMLVFSPVVNLHFDRTQTPDPVPQFFASEPFLQRMDRSWSDPMLAPRIPWLEQPVLLPRVPSLPFATIDDILAASEDRPDTPHHEYQAHIDQLVAIAEGRAEPRNPFENQWRQYALDQAMRETHAGEWVLYADGAFHFFTTYAAAEDHALNNGAAANLLLKVGDEFPGHAVLGQKRSESPLSTGSWHRVPSDTDLGPSTPSP